MQSFKKYIWILFKSFNISLKDFHLLDLTLTMKIVREEKGLFIQEWASFDCKKIYKQKQSLARALKVRQKNTLPLFTSPIFESSRKSRSLARFSETYFGSVGECTSSWLPAIETGKKKIRNSNKIMSTVKLVKTGSVNNGIIP